MGSAEKLVAAVSTPSTPAVVPSPIESSVLSTLTILVEMPHAPTPEVEEMDTSETRKERIVQATEKVVMVEQTMTRLLDAQQTAATKAAVETEEALQISAEIVTEGEARMAADVLAKQLREAEPAAESEEMLVAMAEPE